MKEKMSKASELKTCGVYMITCNASGKRYIGSAKIIWRRWLAHKSLLKRKIHRNLHLQHAFSKYGEMSFEISIVEKCDEKMIIERETFWIEKYQTFNKDFGYNQEPPCKSVMSEETKEKIRLALTGMKSSEQACKNISIGKRKSFEENGVSDLVMHSIENARKNIDKEKLVERNKSRIWTVEMREKLSHAQKGKKKPKRTPEQIENYRRARLKYLGR